MRKTILFFALITSTILFSQEKDKLYSLGKYNMSFFLKQYTISYLSSSSPKVTYDEKQKDQYGFPKQIISKENNFIVVEGCYKNNYIDDNNPLLYIELKKLDEFKENLIFAKQKYNEWTETAKKNNVTDITKKLEKTEREYQTSFFQGTNIFNDFHSQYNFTFSIIKDKSYLIFSNILPLQSSDNEFIKNDGLWLVFSSESEIDGFLFWLDQKRIDYLLNKKVEETDLFK